MLCSYPFVPGILLYLAHSEMPDDRDYQSPRSVLCTLPNLPHGFAAFSKRSTGLRFILALFSFSFYLDPLLLFLSSRSSFFVLRAKAMRDRWKKWRILYIIERINGGAFYSTCQSLDRDRIVTFYVPACATEAELHSFLWTNLSIGGLSS